MRRLFNLKYKKALDRGFTTLEILISIIIALAFVSVAMQSFVLATAMRVQAQEKQRANQLIQEDLETLNNLASNIAEDHNNKCSPAAYANGYAQDLWDDINAVAVPTTQLLIAADGTQTGKTLTLSRRHISDGSSNDPHRTLKIFYQVTDPDTNVIAERYVEVIPDVALQCP